MCENCEGEKQGAASEGSEAPTARTERSRRKAAQARGREVGGARSHGYTWSGEAAGFYSEANENRFLRFLYRVVMRTDLHFLIFRGAKTGVWVCFVFKYQQKSTE